jgi:hypothetical protein
VSGRNCDDCGGPHQNRNVNRCNGCRIGKCDCCGCACKPQYRVCYQCSRSKTTIPPKRPQAPVVSDSVSTTTTIPPKRSQAPVVSACRLCGIMCSPNTFAPGTAVCSSCWDSLLTDWESQFPRSQPGQRVAAPEPVPAELPTPDTKGPTLTDDELADLLGFAL